MRVCTLQILQTTDKYVDQLTLRNSHFLLVLYMAFQRMTANKFDSRNNNQRDEIVTFLVINDE